METGCVSDPLVEKDSNVNPSWTLTCLSIAQLKLSVIIVTTKMQILAMYVHIRENMKTKKVSFANDVVKHSDG